MRAPTLGEKPVAPSTGELQRCLPVCARLTGAVMVAPLEIQRSFEGAQLDEGKARPSGIIEAGAPQDPGQADQGATPLAGK
jgi:hypothetical protein